MQFPIPNPHVTAEDVILSAYKSSPTAFCNWYYKLVPQFGYIMPKSASFFFSPMDAFHYSEGKTDTELGMKLANFELPEGFSFPVFMKLGTYSGKHYNLCFAQSPEDVRKNVAAIWEAASLSFVFPMPCEFVVREIIPTQPAFHAFNGFPIVKERRYSVIDGKTVAHWPYWPPFSIQDADCEDWEDRLAIINAETQEEVQFLADLSERVAKVLEGHNWCIDFLFDKHGNWWITDIQEYECSFHWDDYRDKTLYL